MRDVINAARNVTLGDIIGAAVLVALVIAGLYMPVWLPVVAGWLDK